MMSENLNRLISVLITQELADEISSTLGGTIPVDNDTLLSLQKIVFNQYPVWEKEIEKQREINRHARALASNIRTLQELIFEGNENDPRIPVLRRSYAILKTAWDIGD